MKYIIPIIILSFVLLSCSKEESEEETITELEGTWKTDCYTRDNTSFIDTITFAGNSITGNFEKHSDTSCATDYSLEGFNWTFSIGDAVTFSNGTGHKFSITIGSTYKLTPQSASAVSAFNSKPECSKSDWELNTEIDCSTGSDVGKALLCLYQLDGNTWYPKCDGSARPSTSDIDTDNASNTFTKQ